MTKTATLSKQTAVATVLVDGKRFTGSVYHMRDNGWPCVKCEDGHVASGPIAPDGEAIRTMLIKYETALIECRVQDARFYAILLESWATHLAMDTEYDERGHLVPRSVRRIAMRLIHA